MRRVGPAGQARKLGARGASCYAVRREESGGSMVRQYRLSSVARLTFRVWLHNLIPFTLLSALLSALLIVSLVLDGSGLGSATLLFSAERSYGMLVLRGLTALLAPMISARVVQSFDGVDLSLVRSIRLSGRGVLTMLLFSVLAFLLSFLPVLGVIATLCLSCIWFVAVPAAITERLNPFAALGHSSSLISRRYATTIALMLASVVIAAIPYWITYTLLARLPDATSAVPGSYEDMIARMQQLRPYAIALAASSSVLLPFQGIVRAVSYVLLRRDSTGNQQELAQVFE
jgi:hypothetical protein